MLTFLVGGARSGKSLLGQRLASASVGPGSVVTAVVTAEAFFGGHVDEEMTTRITRHQADRPAGWITVEATHQLALSLEPLNGVILIDCLSLWVSNRMLADVTDNEIEAEAKQAASWASQRVDRVVAVSNEVGSGIVPDNALARRYRDVLGRVNATWAEAAEAAYLVVAGRLLRLERADW